MRYGPVVISFNTLSIENPIRLYNIMHYGIKIIFMYILIILSQVRFSPTAFYIGPSIVLTFMAK